MPPQRGSPARRRASRPMRRRSGCPRRFSLRSPRTERPSDEGEGKEGHARMTFWRWLFFLIKVGVVALAAVWIAAHPGRVSFVWLGYRLDTSTGVLLAV